MNISTNNIFLQKTSLQQAGFTLLEVMVALAIIAVAMAGIMTTVSTNIANASGLRDRTIAHWIAMNKLTELHIERDWPSTRTYEDTEVMAEHEWGIKTIVKKADDPLLKKLTKLKNNLREVEIQIRYNEDDEDPYYTFRTLIAKP